MDSNNIAWTMMMWLSVDKDALVKGLKYNMIGIK